MRMRIAILICSLCGLTLGVQGQTLDPFFPGGPDTVKLCNVSSLFLVANVNTSTPAAAFYRWQLVSGGVTSTLLSAQGASTLSLPSSDFTVGDVDTINVRVGASEGNYTDLESIEILRDNGIVAPDPITIDDAVFCGSGPGVAIQLTANLNGSTAYTASDIFWGVGLSSTDTAYEYFSTGLSSTAFPGSSALPRTLTVMGIDPSGCLTPVDSARMTFEDPQPPMASNDTAYCQGETPAQLSATLSDANNTLEWFDGNMNSLGSTAPVPATNTVGVFKFYVQESTPDCDSEQDSVIVTVNYVPSNALNASATTVCQGTAITFTADNDVAISTYQWRRNGTQVALNSANTYTITQPSQSGSYTVLMTTSAGCETTSQAIAVTINPLPTIGFVSEPPTDMCSGDAPISLPFAIGLPTSPANQQWTASPGNSINGQNGFDPSEYTPGNVTVTLVVTDNNSCVDSTSRTIDVNYEPDDVVTATATAICDGENVTLTADQNPLIQGYQWFRNGAPINGSVSSTLVVSIAGTYHVEIDGQENCNTVSQSTTVTVRDLPNIDFGAAPPPSMACLNDVPFDLPILSPDTFATQVWTSSDGTIVGTREFDPVDFGTGAATITITVEDTEGCVSDESFPIMVNDTPGVAFTVDPACLREETTFANGSTNADSYSWDFGNGSSSTDENPALTYAAAGDFSIQLVATNDTTGCSSTTEETATVLPLPENSVAAIDPKCYNEAAFNLPDPPAGVSYTWGAPVNGTQLLPSDLAGTDSLNTVNGAVEVRIVDNTTQCRDSFDISITILPKPVAKFTFDPFCFSEVTSFTNESTPTSDVSFFWDFGENGTNDDNSTETNPTYEYQADAGSPEQTNFTVTLTITANSDCQDQVTQLVEMRNDGPARSGIERLGPDILVATDTAAATYQWYRDCGTGFEAIDEPSADAGDNRGNRQFYHIADDAQLSCKYRVETTNGLAGSCPTTSAVFDERRSVPLPDSYGLQVFPNPNQGSFTFSLFHPATGTTQIQIYDRLGRLVYENNVNKPGDLQQQRIALHSLEAGVYFVSARIGRNHRFIQKMIIQ